MTHLLDTSALLAHYLGEPGAEQVQAIFEDDSSAAGVSVLSLYEFELRLHQLGLDKPARAEKLLRYRALLGEVVSVDDPVREKALHLRTSSASHIAAMDASIAATASVRNAVFVHRDPHFSAIPANLLRQETLPAK